MRPLIVPALVLTLAVAACGEQGGPSDKGACSIVAPPGRQVCGQTAEDQAYIDYFITRYGAACHWEAHPTKPCVRISIDPAKATPKERKLLDRLLRREPK